MRASGMAAIMRFRRVAVVEAILTTTASSKKEDFSCA